MNEQLQAKLVEILSGIQAAVKAGADFALEQLPDIAQQYVAFGRAHSMLVVLGCAMLAVLLAVRATKSAQTSMANIKNDYGFAHFLLAVACGIGALICAITVGANTKYLLMVWFAPKVWLLKELATLVK